jgi:hypothetical protein
MMAAKQRDGAVMTTGTLAIALSWIWIIRDHRADGEWLGVDEAVVGRIVEQAGRAPEPLVDWVRGDVLLFAFLVAGLLAGFTLGWFAHTLRAGSSS